ncbi:MAG: isoaspartyl peptidase/L-asparaginase, partial [Thermaerobacterales bacterium]
QDRLGNIACGVSTSGWAWKYPGRAGDSPIIGAGNYCDNRYGGAACTGRGELAIRGATAHSIVSGMAHGLTLEESALRALREVHAMEDDFRGRVSVAALDAQGRPGGFTSSLPPDGRRPSYVYMSPDMAEPVVADLTVLDTDGARH